jgi:hypothetical protein
MVTRFGVDRKAILNTMNVCVLLVIRHAKRMRSHFIIISAYLNVPWFSHCVINATIFGNIIFNKKLVFLFSLQLLFDTFLKLKETIIKVHEFSCKVALILVRF